MLCRPSTVGRGGNVNYVHVHPGREYPWMKQKTGPKKPLRFGTKLGWQASLLINHRLGSINNVILIIYSSKEKLVKR